MRKGRMKFALSILSLFVASALSASCQTGQVITNAELCAEIPFVDGPEGACVWTVTKEAEIIDAETWQDRRKYMLMIHVDSWSNIKRDWLKACRIAGPECNVVLQSVDDAIQKLDQILKKLFPNP